MKGFQANRFDIRARHIQIIAMRIQAVPYPEIAALFAISKERARQIYERAKLKRNDAWKAAETVAELSR